MTVLNMKLWHYIDRKWKLVLYNIGHAETSAPCKHDLHESLMTQGRSPAKKINVVLSAEWEALIFGHRQDEKIRHQKRSLETQETVQNFQGKDLFCFFPPIISKGQYGEYGQHLQTLTGGAAVQYTIEETWSKGQRSKDFIICFNLATNPS